MTHNYNYERRQTSGEVAPTSDLRRSQGGIEVRASRREFNRYVLASLSILPAPANKLLVCTLSIQKEEGNKEKAWFGNFVANTVGGGTGGASSWVFVFKVCFCLFGGAHTDMLQTLVFVHLPLPLLSTSTHVYRFNERWWVVHCRRVFGKVC